MLIQKQQVLRLTKRSPASCRYVRAPFVSRRLNGEVFHNQAASLDITLQHDDPVNPSAPEETELPQGPASDEAFDWSKAWYPVAVLDELDPKRPHQITLLGEDYVLWKDAQGTWRAFADRCPHRLAPLSEGLIAPDGTLLCAYHAWRFDGTGQCTAIPQSLNKEAEAKACANPRSCAQSYPTCVTEGLVWMWPSSGPTAEQEAAASQPAVTTPQDRPDMFKAGWRSQHLMYGHDYFLENVVDPAHVVVAHHGIAGNRYKDPMPLPFTTIQALTRDHGFKMSAPSRNKGATYTCTFRPPCHVRIDNTYEDGAAQTLNLYVYPTKPGHSMHIGRQEFTPGPDGKFRRKQKGLFGLGLPEWLLHILGPKFLNQDGVFLHRQERIAAQSKYRDLRAMDKYFTPTSADKQVLTLRRWFERYVPQGIPFKGEFENQDISPIERDSEKVFDVYNTHTKRCKICLEALDKLNKAHVAAWAVCALSCVQVAISLAAQASAQAATAVATGAVVSVNAAVGSGLVLPPWSAVAWSLLAVAAAAAASTIQKLVKMFYVVPYSHADNP